MLGISIDSGSSSKILETLSRIISSCDLTVILKEKNWLCN